MAGTFHEPSGGQGYLGLKSEPSLNQSEVVDLVDLHFRKVTPQVVDYTRALLIQSINDSFLLGPEPRTDSKRYGTPKRALIRDVTEESTRIVRAPMMPGMSVAGMASAVAGKPSRELRLLHAEHGPPKVTRAYSIVNSVRTGIERTSSSSDDFALTMHIKHSAEAEDKVEQNVKTMQDFLFELGLPGPLMFLFTPVVDVIQFFVDLAEPDREGSCLDGFIYSSGFQALSNAAILFNLYEATTAADYEMVHGEGSQNDFIRQAKEILLTFYCVELFFKLLNHRLYFFVNDNWSWNCLDFLLIAQSLTDRVKNFDAQALHQPDGQPTSGGGFTFMRILKLLKIAKALRVLKFIKAFAELRVMMDTLKNSFISLFWMMIMLMAIFYIFGLICVQGASQALQNFELDPDYEDRLRKYFGTTFRAMNSMYMAGFGGVTWDFMYEMMAMNGPLYGWSFLFYVAFINIVVFNVLTAVFVDNVMKLAQPDEEQIAAEWTASKMASMKEIRQLALAMDRDHNGTISWEEFVVYVNDPLAQCKFHEQVLDIRSAEMFYKTLQTMTTDGEVRIEAFVEGCSRMKGLASSIDLHIVSVQVRMLQRLMTKMFHQNEQIHHRVHQNGFLPAEFEEAPVKF